MKLSAIKLECLSAVSVSLIVHRRIEFKTHPRSHTLYPKQQLYPEQY
eukprot:COSAG05_NODE_116_length_17986_cov_348.987534_4_plen_47_part_00